MAARVTLVLGAGGSVGHAYHLGVLSAIADELGWDARRAELIIGTSAGSVVGAGLRAGLSAGDMRARVHGEPLTPAGRRIVRRGEAAVAAVATARAAAGLDVLPVADVDVAARLRRLRMASPERVLRAMREPWRVSPGSLLSAMIPAGRLPTDHLGAPYDALFADVWPRKRLWIVAVELDVGRRVVFGRDERLDGDQPSVGQAVQASCAIPGYFAPVTIGETRYVDGGVHSTTNADLAAPDAAPAKGRHRRPPDVVIVSAPMSPERAGSDLSPKSALRQIARRWLASELATLRERGVETVTFQPTSADLGTMVGDSMDPAKAPAVVEQARLSTVERLRDPDVADQLAVLSP